MSYKKPRYTEHKESIHKHKMTHMIGVAEYMREYATDYGLDPDEMYVVGLLHDIGNLQGYRAGHEEAGYDLLEKMGLKPEYALAIKNHGTSPYRVFRDQDVYTQKQYKQALTLLYVADYSVNKYGQRVKPRERAERILKGKKDAFVRGDIDEITYKRVKENVEETLAFVETVLKSKEKRNELERE